jgi:hypothetical protein
MWGMTFEKSLRMFSPETLEDQARDAARYRWLRDKAGNDIMRTLMMESRPDEWDKLVDRDRGGPTVPREQRP